MTQEQKMAFVKALFEQTVLTLDSYKVDHVECWRYRASESFFTVTIVGDGIAELGFEAEWKPPQETNVQMLETMAQKMTWLKAFFEHHVSLGGYEVDHIELQYIYPEDGSFRVMVVADWGAELRFKADWKDVVLPAIQASERHEASIGGPQ